MVTAIVCFFLIFAISHIFITIWNIAFSIRIQKKDFKKYLSLKTVHCNDIFFILIPMFHESSIAKVTVESAIENAANIDNTTIVFITHSKDKETSDIVAKVLSKYKKRKDIIHIINTNKCTIKAHQLRTAIKHLKNIIKDNDFISVYDCDSYIDSRVFLYISNYLKINNIKKSDDICFQQTPHYPRLIASKLIEVVALSRGIHSINYTYSTEIRSYKKHENKTFLKMNIHLIGHGEHIRFQSLKKAGGFLPPSCDSSLGFALSCRQIPIISIPIPDIAATPNKIYEIYYQGLRWFNGCELYKREGKKVDSNFQLKISTLLTFINNLRWYALPVSLVASIVMNIIFSQFTTVTIILLFIFICVFYLRHILNYIAYRQLNKLSNASNIVPLWKWISLYFITYSIIRLFWAIPPLHYYFKKIFGFDVFITTTLKDIEDVAILVKNMAATSQFVAIGIGTPIAERPSQVSSPKELPPQALPEPDMRLSTHPAPIVQSF